MTTLTPDINPAPKGKNHGEAAMSEWIEHDGKGMPVDGETRVALRFRDGDMRVGRAGFWHGDGDGDTQWVFNPGDPDFDIVAYRVLTSSEPTP